MLTGSRTTRTPRRGRPCSTRDEHALKRDVEVASRGIYLSVDIRVLDSAYAPGAGDGRPQELGDADASASHRLSFEVAPTPDLTNNPMGSAITLTDAASYLLPASMVYRTSVPRTIP